MHSKLKGGGPEDVAGQAALLAPEHLRGLQAKHKSESRLRAYKEV